MALSRIHGMHPGHMVQGTSNPAAHAAHTGHSVVPIAAAHQNEHATSNFRGERSIMTRNGMFPLKGMGKGAKGVKDSGKGGKARRMRGKHGPAHDQLEAAVSEETQVSIEQAMTMDMESNSEQRQDQGGRRHDTSVGHKGDVSSQRDNRAVPVPAALRYVRSICELTAAWREGDKTGAALLKAMQDLLSGASQNAMPALDSGGLRRVRSHLYARAKPSANPALNQLLPLLLLNLQRPRPPEQRQTAHVRLSLLLRDGGPR
ncbi:hypothetical protein [Bordetella muralis]|jgi:hypothetical protein|uniref:hypothetical protein n=1 Tax=Bordetella muralis TaxID=1649130 RepID=UPI0039EDF3E0